MIDTTTSSRPPGVARALRRAALPLALLAALAGCNSGTTPATASSPSAQTSPEIHRIEALGRTIYVLDNAAARATDLALAEGADLRASNMRGWVTDSSSSGVLVRFIRQRGDRFEAAYDVTVDESGRAAALTRPTNPTLTPDQSAQLAARRLAMSNFVPLCQLPYNPVVFRDPGTRDWRVYLLATTTDPQVKVYAGHHRFLVSGDGSRVLSSEPLSKTCLAPRLEVPPGQAPQFFLMTELLSPAPTETHVFDSLLYRLPILVVTVPEKRQWIVDQGRISGPR